MKYWDHAFSLTHRTWVAILCLCFGGCNQSLSDRPASAGARSDHGVGGNSSGGSTSDASLSPRDAACEPDADATPEDASLPRDFPDVEMDALPPAAPVPACSTMVSFAQTKVLLELGPNGTILGSVTPDGLTAAWTVPGSFSPGSSQPPSVRVADRVSSDAAFGQPQTVDTGEWAIGHEKVALSPDGLRLVVVRADLQGFFEMRRANPAIAFGLPTEVDFADINSSVSGTADALTNPTIAPDDKSIVYTRAQTIQESRRAATTRWPVGVTVKIDYPPSASQHYLRPSSVSQDLLTIFFWDDEKSLEVAAWRVFPTDPFERTVRIGALQTAQPNVHCRTLYFASHGDDGSVYLAQADGSFSP